MGISFRPFLLTKDFLTTVYGIDEGGQVFARRGAVSSALVGGGPSFNRRTPLSEIRSANASGLIVGDVSFEMKSGITEVKWERVFLPTLKANLVEQFKTSAKDREADRERRQEKQRKLQDRKDNLDLSDQVLLVPCAGGVFDKPLWQRRSGEYPKKFFNIGGWIEKGEILCQFEVKEPGLFGRELVIPIYSPVSGRILSSPENQGMGSNWGETDKAFSDTENDFPLCAIQVANGEEVPSSTEDSYKDFAEICWDNRVKLFQTDEFNMDDAALQKLFTQMRTQSFHIVDLNSSGYAETAEWIDKNYGGLNIPEGPA